MINTLIGVWKYILPLIPSFWIVVNLVSFGYPQYIRYKQDIQMKKQAALVVKKLVKKMQKIKLQDFILSEANEIQDELIQTITHYTLQKQRLQRLKESLNHVANIDPKQIAKMIEDIEKAKHIELMIKQELPNMYSAKLKKPVYLEEADVLFLLYVLNQPSVEVQSLTFQKEEKLDGEVFLLGQLEVTIYEGKS